MDEVFSECFQNIRRPSAFLEDSSRKSRLLSFLNSSGRNRQGLLFDNGEDCETLLDESIQIYCDGKLYRRWKQEVNGKVRRFAVSHPRFNNFVSSYVLPIVTKEGSHEKSRGGENRWTPKLSLQTHLPCETALSLDLADAFNQVGVRQVFEIFYTNLSHLPEEDRRDFSKLFAMTLTVTNGDFVTLPQGSPHSMPLFNRALRGLDTQLDEEAAQRGIFYSRWVDDITLTSPENMRVEDYLGAVGLVQKNYRVAKNKIFYQRVSDGPVYLLGHVIEMGKVFKNSKEDREKNKVKPLDYESIPATESW